MEEMQSYEQLSKTPTQANRMREIFGLIALTFGALLFLSLLTYHPEDPCWNLAGHGVTRNAAGPVGAYVSDIFLQMFGIGAYFIVFLAFLCALMMILQRRIAFRWISLVGYACIGLLISSFFHLWWGHWGPHGYSTGGAAGQWLATLLVSQTGRGGSYLLLTMMLALSVVWTTQFSFVETGSRIAERMSPHTRRWALGFHERFLDWRDAWYRWRSAKHANQRRERKPVFAAAGGDLPALELDHSWLDADPSWATSDLAARDREKVLPELTPPAGVDAYRAEISAVKISHPDWSSQAAGSPALDQESPTNEGTLRRFASTSESPEATEHIPHIAISQLSRGKSLPQLNLGTLALSVPSERMDAILRGLQDHTNADDPPYALPHNAHQDHNAHHDYNFYHDHHADRVDRRTQPPPSHDKRITSLEDLIPISHADIESEADLSDESDEIHTLDVDDPRHQQALAWSNLEPSLPTNTLIEQAHPTSNEQTCTDWPHRPLHEDDPETTLLHEPTHPHPTWNGTIPTLEQPTTNFSLSAPQATQHTIQATQHTIQAPQPIDPFGLLEAQIILPAAANEAQRPFGTLESHHLPSIENAAPLEIPTAISPIRPMTIDPRHQAFYAHSQAYSAVPAPQAAMTADLSLAPQFESAANFSRIPQAAMTADFSPTFDRTSVLTPSVPPQTETTDNVSSAALTESTSDFSPTPQAERTADFSPAALTESTSDFSPAPQAERTADLTPHSFASSSSFADAPTPSKPPASQTAEFSAKEVLSPDLAQTSQTPSSRPFVLQRQKHPSLSPITNTQTPSSQPSALPPSTIPIARSTESLVKKPTPSLFEEDEDEIEDSQEAYLSEDSEDMENSLDLHHAENAESVEENQEVDLSDGFDDMEDSLETDIPKRPESIGLAPSSAPKDGRPIENAPKHPEPRVITPVRSGLTILPALRADAPSFDPSHGKYNIAEEADASEHDRGAAEEAKVSAHTRPATQSPTTSIHNRFATEDAEASVYDRAAAQVAAAEKANALEKAEQLSLQQMLPSLPKALDYPMEEEAPKLRGVAQSEQAIAAAPMLRGIAQSEQAIAAVPMLRGIAQSEQAIAAAPMLRGIAQSEPPIAAAQESAAMLRGMAQNEQPPGIAQATAAMNGPLVQAKARAKSGDELQQQTKPAWRLHGYQHPSLDLLDYVEQTPDEDDDLLPEILVENARVLEKTLETFGIKGEVQQILPGPVITMYEYLPAPGIKVSRIASLADNLAMSLAAVQVRVLAPIPGKNCVGIELPNRKREVVYIKELLADERFQKTQAKLPMAMGKDTTGTPYIANLAKMPHLLIAGTTGSGKSVGVNSMIVSLLYHASPEDVRFIMIDPKMLELSIYDGIPHLLLPVVTDAKKAATALAWAVNEMERRYSLMAEAGVRNINNYNALVEQRKKAREFIEQREARLDAARREALREDDIAEEPAEMDWESSTEYSPDELYQSNAPKSYYEKMPYIVVIIDELADLMMVAAKEVEFSIARLAQMARAAGIHLMLATQRPSVDVLTGVIKANFPSRCAFQLKSKIDSRTILDQPGAERLLGQGDMLLTPPSSSAPVRIHGCYVSEEEVHRVVNHLKKQGDPEYNAEILPSSEGQEEGEEFSDDMYDKAIEIVVKTRNASISALQRKLRIGYNRAARMIEQMAREGIVGEQIGSKPREILAPEGES
ncbi:DNA translocase FtsK 4TM domain-containing protein [Myxococcota bacterium]|nr:DNA translocase FtsK 4TM domain-containing protein [Myxococcota bacterium]